ncbi:hypothetical protein Bhyg_08896 [Pseudolycoriella hygida]|uniref:PHD-type domain-containing protein n=1 Tax=Pseudolycoriella hygida TaxID=35572 RepID=A0A9Q0N6H3_9DIPT|nr:hypothetical protein Bhyg_08896 [Pseudolycoriella hygida]
MSGHNPHGRLGQPNTSYNHLQVPYIPRHPQLAHMNESIMRSSPLNWHQADAAFFSYMTTQHKTQLDLNALPFVRPPADSSFGTVDLSFPSHYRHNSSPHNTNNTLAPSSAPPSLEFSAPLQFSPKSSLNWQVYNLRTSSEMLKQMHAKYLQNITLARGVDGLYTTNKSKINSLSPALQSPNSVKEAKGGFVNGDKISNNGSEKLFNSESVMAPNLTTGLFVAHQPSMTHSEPIELIKEKIFKNFHELIEHNSAINPTSLPSHSPSPSIFASLTNSAMNNNTNLQRLSELPSPNHANISNSHNTSRESQATTSNEDSVDSNAGKKRRRRKPNKTCRLSNNEDVDDDIDVDVISNNNKHLETVASNNSGDVSGSNKLNNISEVVNLASCENKNSESVNEIVESDQPVPTQTESNGQSSVAKSNVNDASEISLSPAKPATQTIQSPNKSVNDNNSGNVSPNRWPLEKPSDADADCETIDKIAALIASSSPDFDPKKGRSTPMPENRSSPILENGNSKGSATEDNADQKDRRFEDVEIKLEEMFAGIDDDIDQTKVKNTKLGGCKVLETIVPKSENRKKINAKTRKKKSNSSSSDEEEDHKAKKPVKRLQKSKTKKGKGKKNTKPAKGGTNVTDNQKAKAKDETLDTVAKFRGPFVHVTVDGSSNVVNAPITEEISETKLKVKKALNNQSQNDRSKIRGLHVSTLSMKYDASTTDKTWMCVFCKMGPHKFGLGDLFGPYILSTTCEDFELSQVSPSEDVFRSKKSKANMIQKRTLPSDAATTGNKRKRKATEQTPSTSINSTSSDVVDIFYGMTKTTDTSYEVWVHGDCAVWSSGVYLIGSRIVGLEAAVWSSSRHQCTKCQNYGAMLSCFKRGCGDVAHVPCARKASWNLCDENFKVLCDKHCVSVEQITESAKQT